MVTSVTSVAVSIKFASCSCRTTYVVVSATMVTLLRVVMCVAMIAVLLSRRSSYTGRPRRHFNLDVLRRSTVVFYSATFF